MVAWSQISTVHLAADSRPFESSIGPQKENKTLLCWQVLHGWRLRLGFNSRKGSQQLCVCVCDLRGQVTVVRVREEDDWLQGDEIQTHTH